ncbi:hypothetical protein Nekkels1_80 [Cellulophaga phage Nekkels_1]|uniref:Uncharacterized protein n=1 Tax=Cellulophaga phage Nekkels_1 TaxID=2745692 RepID=A0A8E4UXK0_9CAUD|nr:hypothetical protein M1M31_gp80 [Cellulophaga phage Nekkels_1]QQO97086.1 hypothetical protein Nekkels1_80 [Cellulophaga phage Nekkels_1]
MTAILIFSSTVFLIGVVVILKIDAETRKETKEYKEFLNK